MNLCIVKGTTASASGEVQRGYRKVTFLFSSTFAGTLLGMTMAGATDTAPLTIEAPDNCTLGALPYTRSAGSVRIITYAAALG